MKMRMRLSVIPLFVFFLIITGASPADAVINIMPLGDSITEGAPTVATDPNEFVSYRFALWELLDGAGYDVDYVGSLNNGSSVFGSSDLADHEGHGGWRDDEIVTGRVGEGKLADWLVDDQPNIVLLHIGTNALDSSPDDVQDILNVIDDYEVNSGRTVWVILARIINRITHSSTTTDFNDNVEAMANAQTDVKVKIVDMEVGAGIIYDYYYNGGTPPGDMYNDLHPYTTGYEKMADVWFDGLLEILPVADAGSAQEADEFEPVALDGTGSSDPKSGTLSFEWTQTGGTSVTLSNELIASPTFDAPDIPASEETLTFELKVTDEDGLESVDTTTVLIHNPDSTSDPGGTSSGVVAADGGGGGGCFIATSSYGSFLEPYGNSFIVFVLPAMILFLTIPGFYRVLLKFKRQRD